MAEAAEGALSAEIPLFARVHLAHAVVQRIAEEAGVSLLHLKGPAVLPGLRPAGKQSSDVDVLVRPGHFTRLEDALRSRGWERASQLSTGSAFEHAANWWHDDWGYADLHALWPGPTVGPDETFDTLAEDGEEQPIAHVACPVPGRTAQILVLLLHAARSPGERDLELVWHSQSQDQQDAVRHLAARLGAQVAMAAALDELDDHRGDRTYDLWRVHRDGGGRLDEWRARYRAADSPAARIRVVASAARVNRDHLLMQLGHRPSRAELRRAQVDRVATLGREALQLVVARLPGRRDRGGGG